MTYLTKEKDNYKFQIKTREKDTHDIVDLV